MYEEGFSGGFIFEREFYFYHTVCKLFTRIIEEEGASLNFIEMVPKSFKAKDSVCLDKCIEQPLLLEDVTSSNFRLTGDGIGRFDLLEAEQALESYGKFHAIGLRFCEKEVPDNHDHE